MDINVGLASHVVRELLSAVDDGLSITIAELNDHADAGDLIAFVADKTKGSADFSVVRSDPAAVKSLTALINDTALAFSGRQRKFGTNHNGLLYMAAILISHIDHVASRVPLRQP